MVDGDKIRSLRKAANLTQAELGEEVGVSQNAINFFENGLKDPQVKVLARIAKRLGCTVDELIIND